MQSEKDDFERALYKALTITERKISYRRAIPYLRLAFKKVSAWRRLSGFEKRSKTFQRRLALDGLNLLSFASVLGPPPSPATHEATIWLKDFVSNEYRDVDINIQSLASFEVYLDRGLIAPFKAQLLSHVGNLYSELDISSFCRNESARISIVDSALSSQLVPFENLVRRAVVLEINILRLRKKLQGDTPTERYAAFLKLCEASSYRISFHKRYPVLARLVHTRLNQWHNNTIELVKRLETDWEEICSTFKVEMNDQIKGISTGGDTHNSGRAVTTIALASGKSIVYKPRSVSLENRFQVLLKYFNSMIDDLNLKTMKVIEKQNYGWIEFIDSDKATDQSQLQDYFLKIGALTAITHPMHGVDFFFENVVASKQGPVFIDLETLFHQSLERESANSAREKTQLILQESVLGMGILPQPQQGANSREIFDISVIGARQSQQAPYNVTGLTNLARDDISIKKIPGWIPSTHSSPIDDHANIVARKYFLDGYDLITNYILENKEAYLSEPGPIASFSGAIRRLIVRDTKTYGGLLADESHPDLLRDQSNRQWHWDNLWSELKRRPILDRFIYSELQQLMQGDIPYFYGSVNQRSVTGADTSKINLDDVLEYTPLESAKKNISELNNADVDKQRWYIGVSLGLTGIPGLTSPQLSPKKSHSENSIAVGNYILSKLVYFGDESWFVATQNPTPGVMDNRAVRFLPASHGLYDGVAGVAYFLAMLGQRSSEEKYRCAARSLVKSLIRDINASITIESSGFTGKASIVYVLDKLNIIWGQTNEISDAISALITQIKIEEEENLDVLSGTAGIALALLPYTIRSGNNNGIEILRLAKNKLSSVHQSLLTAEEPVSGLAYLRGFAHGLSGIALTLYRLSEYFDDTRALAQSKELIIREAELVGNLQWTDSHQYGSGPLSAWCHGAPGIALALTKMPKLLEDAVVKEYLMEAIDYSFNTGFYDSACLCHGSLGNIEILEAANYISMHSRDFQNLTSAIVSKLATNGFTSFGNDQTFSLSLMTGISGLGYGLLRLSNTDATPSILSLE